MIAKIAAHVINSTCENCNSRAFEKISEDILWIMEAVYFVSAMIESWMTEAYPPNDFKSFQ